MSEYIKQEDALDAVLFALVGTGHQSNAICAIRDIPTSDVVEVVRCKDCVYSEKTLSDECPKECSWCGKLSFVTHEKHYCSYGERREK